MDKYIDKAIDMLMAYGPKVLLAIIVLLVGLKLIKVVTKLVANGFEKRKVDPTLQPFVLGLVSWSFKILLFISVASMVGIETTSFVAVLGAAGLAIGLALQGTLSNFAGGVLILILKPYKLGDLVSAQGEFGEVKEIGIFNTILLTPENKTAIIPNGAVMNGNITNVSEEGKLRVDLTVSVAYDSNLKVAKEALYTMMKNDPDVLDSPQPLVAVSELGDSAIKLAVRPYCTPEKYWDVYFRVLENTQVALVEAGVTIPYPQMDLHVHNA